jgi:hypothetical protein
VSVRSPTPQTKRSPKGRELTDSRTGPPMLAATSATSREASASEPHHCPNPGINHFNSGYVVSVCRLEPTDGGNDVVSFEHLEQSVEDKLVIVGSRLQVFFEDALGFAYCLQRYLLIGHHGRLGWYNET